MSDLNGSSQESDYFPEEVKHILTDPAVQDVINCVQTQDPYHVMQAVPHYDDYVRSTIPCEVESQDQLQVIKIDGTTFVEQPPDSGPSPTCLMLCTEDYPGPYDFEIQLNGEPSGKGWLFSHTLNKLFIIMGSSVNLSFKCNTFHPGLFIRAIAVYTDDDAFREPVNRCVVHRSRTENLHNETEKHVLHHVVRIEDALSQYCYDVISQRRSVRVPLRSPQPGTDWVNIALKFMCKNSCLSGMNRRPIEVIFTLENINEFVYGRQKVKVRICSCPKRDKEKEEKVVPAPPGKRRMENNNNSGGRTTKQRKTEDEQNNYFLVPVDHLDDYRNILDYAHFKLKKRLKIEKREPNEKEADLLQTYEAEIPMQVKAVRAAAAIGRN